MITIIQRVVTTNGFGHSTSHTSVLEHDTALEIQRGNLALQSCLQNKVFTTLVWDNNDFGEETLTGKGTTHNTNGIAIQHEPGNQEQPAAPAVTVKKTRERSICGSSRAEIGSILWCKKNNTHTISLECKDP